MNDCSVDMTTYAHAYIHTCILARSGARFIHSLETQRKNKCAGSITWCVDARVMESPWSIYGYFLLCNCRPFPPVLPLAVATHSRNTSHSEEDKERWERCWVFTFNSAHVSKNVWCGFTDVFTSRLLRPVCSQGGWFGAGVQSHPGTCLIWLNVLSPTQGVSSF